MYTQNELKSKTVKNLKELADGMNVNYKKTIRKAELIDLILMSSKVEETAASKQAELNESTASSVSQPDREEHHYEPQTFMEGVPELPSFYGKDKMVFMVRDPFWGFVYWEVSENTTNQHGFYNEGIDRYLRIYNINDVNDPAFAKEFFDLKIDSVASNWYINFPTPNSTYIVDLGYFVDGNFVTVLRSNPATAPRNDVSDQIDEEWMLSEEQYKYILQASGADALFQQMGSQELMKFLAGNINENVSSGLSSSSIPIGSSPMGSSPMGSSFNK